MNIQEIIKDTEHFIKARFKSDGSGHDWYHIDRVRRMAIKIGKQEGGDLSVIELAALLHDLDDWKLTGAETLALKGTINWLHELEVEESVSSQVISIIEDVSFKGSGVDTPVHSLEAAVVQDADRLDAIGAIGIARTFAYGGHKNRLIYDPAVSPEMHADFQEYKKGNGPTINHFYEKLLLLKDRMNTETAKSMADERHRFMMDFLDRFYDEWDSKR